jgi:hypothetical protein
VFTVAFSIAESRNETLDPDNNKHVDNKDKADDSDKTLEINDKLAEKEETKSSSGGGKDVKRKDSSDTAVKHETVDDDSDAKTETENEEPVPSPKSKGESFKTEEKDVKTEKKGASVKKEVDENDSGEKDSAKDAVDSKVTSAKEEEMDNNNQEQKVPPLKLSVSGVSMHSPPTTTTSHLYSVLMAPLDSQSPYHPAFNSEGTFISLSIVCVCVCVFGEPVESVYS